MVHRRRGPSAMGGCHCYPRYIERQASGQVCERRRGRCKGKGGMAKRGKLHRGALDEVESSGGARPVTHATGHTITSYIYRPVSRQLRLVKRVPGCATLSSSTNIAFVACGH